MRPRRRFDPLTRRGKRMRSVQICLGLALLVGAAGCPPEGRFNLLRPTGLGPLPAEVPTKEDLVQYLNYNSSNIPGLQSDDVSLTCYNGPVGVPVGAMLRCQGPRNFRMKATAFGSEEVDLGSNDQEFWYWIRRGDKYQFFCSYQALENGHVKYTPFPFQPGWVMEAMGMGKYGPSEKYELAVEKEQLKLIEKTKSPQGLPVRKVIVFRRRAAQGRDAQVTDFLLLDDATDKEVCAAHISQVQIDRATGTILPYRVDMRWPEMKLRMTMKLDGVGVNPNPPLDPAVAFQRRPLSGVPGFDLATMRPDASLQRVQGFER